MPTYQNDTTKLKTSFLNLPLLIALLITVTLHGLILLELKMDFSPEVQNFRTISITLIKPLPVPVKKTLSVVLPPPAKTAKITKQMVSQPKPHAESVKPVHAKKHHKIRPIIKKTPTPIDSAQTIPPEPIISEPIAEPVVPEPVVVPKVVEPEITPEPVKYQPVEPEKIEPAVSPVVPVEKTPVQPETAPLEAETPPAEVPVRPSRKAGKAKKHRSESVAETSPVLSLEDLSTQIAQVGEKYANQSLSMEENTHKTVNSSRKNKLLGNQYKRDWRSKVERIARANYPDVARQQDFSARVVVEVGINRDGGLDYVRIKKSSGLAELDAAVKNIVQMAAPFSPLPTELAENLKGGVLVISQGMSFHNESVSF